MWESCCFFTVKLTHSQKMFVEINLCAAINNLIEWNVHGRLMPTYWSTDRMIVYCIWWTHLSDSNSVTANLVITFKFITASNIITVSTVLIKMMRVVIQICLLLLSFVNAIDDYVRLLNQTKLFGSHARPRWILVYASILPMYMPLFLQHMLNHFYLTTHSTFSSRECVRVQHSNAGARGLVHGSSRKSKQSFHSFLPSSGLFLTARPVCTQRGHAQTGPSAVQMWAMRQAVRHGCLSVPTSADSHGDQAVRVPLLRAPIHTTEPRAAAWTHSHGRKTLQVSFAVVEIVSGLFLWQFQIIVSRMRGRRWTWYRSTWNFVK